MNKLPAAAMRDAKFPDAEELISAAQIAAGFDRLAASLQPLTSQSDCLLLGVLNGGMFPLVHIAERLNGDFLIDYCHATRYRGAMEGAALEWLEEPHFELSGRTVIIVDDIFDEGATLQAIAGYCRAAGAARVVTAVMVIKERKRDPAMAWPDFDTGLRVPDVYVFGCGMDLYKRWRHLPAIYGLRAGVTGHEEG